MGRANPSPASSRRAAMPVPDRPAPAGPPPPPVPTALLAGSAAPLSAWLPAQMPPPPKAVPLTVDADAPLPVSRSTDGSTTAEDGAGVAQLDLVFCCDCTGSMGSYIRSAQDNIRAIAQSIHTRKGQQCSIRYALVKYRDHPPQDRSFITEVFPFSKSLDVMKANVDTMSASGGGDGPEAVTAALQEVLELNWRETATKVCVFIADAPPHGLGERGDGFPDGSPDGLDPIAVTRNLAQKGVTVYTIGVEPVLSTNYQFARDFFMMVASMTSGKFLPLGKADILAQVIVSTSLEGMQLEQLWADVEADIEKAAKDSGESLSADELCARVETAMKDKAKHVRTEHVEVENPYMDDRYDHANRLALENATSLAAARAHMSSSRNVHVAEESAGYAWQAQQAQCVSAPCSAAQMSRSAGLAKKKKGIW